MLEEAATTPSSKAAETDRHRWLDNGRSVASGCATNPVRIAAAPIALATIPAYTPP